MELTDYLHKQIIKKIINYLLIDNKKKKIDNDINYNKKNFERNIYEILILSLVSKYWYSSVSNLISNNISTGIIDQWFTKLLPVKPEKVEKNKEISRDQDDEEDSDEDMDYEDDEYWDEDDEDDEDSDDFYEFGNYKKYGDGFYYIKVIVQNTNSNSIQKFKMKINQTFSIVKIDKKLLDDYFENQFLILKEFNFKKIIELQSKYSKIEINLSDNQNIKKVLLLTNSQVEKIDKNKVEINIINLSLEKKDQDMDHVYSAMFDGSDSEDEDDEKEEEDDDDEVDVSEGEVGNENERMTYFRSNDESNLFRNKKFIKKLNSLKDRYDGGLINQLHLFGIHKFRSKDLECIKYIKPKVIRYYQANGYWQKRAYFHMNYEPLFNKDKNEMVKELRILGADHVEPAALSKVNELPHLRTLVMQMLLHDIIRAINGYNFSSSLESTCQFRYHALENSIGIKEQFETMLSSLASSDSLKNLNIGNFCTRGFTCFKDKSEEEDYQDDDDDDDEDDEDSDDEDSDDEDSPKKYNKAIKITSTILKTFLTNSKLEYLKLFGWDFLEKSSFSPLINNLSLKTLVLKYISDSKTPTFDQELIEFLFEKVFTSPTSSIKHFKLTAKGYSKSYISMVFKSLSKHAAKINLYSIGLGIKKDELKSTLSSISKIAPLLKESSNLKEFNLFLFDKYKKHSFETIKMLYQFYIKNSKNIGIIINIK